MKRIALPILLFSASLACLAGLDYSDIVKWGLVRRADLPALLPADGYRTVVTTNRTPSFAWILDGYMDADMGEDVYETVLSVSNLVIPGLPRTLAVDGMSGMVPVPEANYIVGAFDNGEGLSGVGLLDAGNPFVSAGCYSYETPDGSSFNLALMPVGNYYYGALSLTRADYPDIVTVTTNYCATGNNAVLRDFSNPRKSVRLVNGSLLLLEEIPPHWVFQGAACFPLTNPLTPFSGDLAGYAWASETAGDPPYLYYALYDENGSRQFASEGFSDVTNSLIFTRDDDPYDVVPMTYVGPSVTTNSL